MIPLKLLIFDFVRIKNVLIIIIFLFFSESIFALNHDSIQLELLKYRQDDKLSNWVETYLELENEYYTNDNILAAQNTLDSIVAKAWRTSKSKEENDQFFKLHWYKSFYLKDNGKIVEAKNQFEFALNYFSKSSKIFSEDLLIIYPPLGNIYTILGENEKAIITHQKMIELSNSLPRYEGKDDDLAIAYTNLSIVYETQNKLNLAVETIKKVKTLPIVSKYNLGIALSNYGKFLSQQNKLNESGKELKNAISLLEEVDNIDSYFLGGIYKTMAHVSIQKQNKLIANKFLDLAIINYKNSIVNRNRELAKSYVEKSKIGADKLKLLNIALQYLIPHSDEFPKEFFPPKSALYAENTLADIFYELTQLPLSPTIILNSFEYYFEVQKLIRKEYLFKNSKKENLQQDRKVIDEAIAFCYFMYSKSEDEKYAIKALEFVENEKSILLFEALANEKNEEYNQTYSAYLSNKKSLIDDLVVAQLNNQNKLIDSIKNDIKILDFNNEINSKLLDRNNAVLAKFDFEKFRSNSLENAEALLVFYDAIDLFSIVVSNKEITFDKTVKDKEFINSINEFTGSFTFENRFNFNKNNSRKIGESIDQLIPKGIKKIYVSTDGLLNNVPFEAFVTGGEYLIEKYEFQYIFSANILQNILYKKVNNHQLLALAPIFKNDATKQLLKSEEEINNVLKLIKGRRLINENANSEKFMEEAKEYAILHISSHAQIDPNIDAASIDFYDKSLYFSQIEQAHFETELLVLSACETGIGKQEIGEGVMSLSKAFAYSKIPSIVSSLWKVNEESSLIIFNSFYANIKSKLSISNSLRKSKLEYLNSSEISEEKKLPYYWASFIHLGEDKVLEIEIVENHSILLYLLFGLVIVFLFGFYFKYKIGH